VPFVVLAPDGQSGNFWIHPRTYPVPHLNFVGYFRKQFRNEDDLPNMRSLYALRVKQTYKNRAQYLLIGSVYDSYICNTLLSLTHVVQEWMSVTSQD
jgi:hypothetical protein